jgi:ribosomal protein S18 acetylase RimI-like enzyme
MHARDFRDGDLRLLVELAQELWAHDPSTVEHTFGELAFWSSRLPHNDWRARLWLDGETLAGWAWMTNALDLDWQVRPTHRPLLDEILEWAHAPERTVVRPHNVDAIERLRRHGLELDESAPWIRVNVRDLADLPEPAVPDGYGVRTVADGDHASRAAAHRSAFHPSRFTDAVYESVRAAWPYRSDLDCVVEAPDGTIASFTLAWFDDVNGIGELEPVGTHSDHLRRGLARAANLFALHRLKALGATRCLVGCRGDAAYPIPCKLYESIGFREWTRAAAVTRKATR